MPADPTTRRYFRIDGGGPTWWTVSPSAAHAWKQWAEWHIDSGATDEVVDEEPTMRELTAEEAAAIRVADERPSDTRQCTLADLEVGATICTEF